MQASQNSQGTAQPLAHPQQGVSAGLSFPAQQPQQQQQGTYPPAMQLPQQQQQPQQQGTMTSNNFSAAAVPPQQPQQQQQQSFPHQGLNGGWQSDKDYQERRKMIGKIVLLLQQRKPNAPAEWLKKLPQMAKRLEESLYRSAKSFVEYNDANTLKQRLQQLAVSIGLKTKKMQQAQILQHQKKLQQQVQQQQQQQQQAAAAKLPNQQVAQQQQQVAQPAAAQHLMPVQQVVQQAPVQVATSAPQRMVNMSEINPIIAAAAPQAPAPAPLQQIQYASQPPPTQRQQAVAPVPAPAAAAPAPAASGGRQVSDRQQVLRHQQQRLLLLRHAAKCQHEDNRCPVTPHCAGMKRLWKHIAECKNQKCLVPHCVSSRYVLSHYHRCKDVRCPVCGPVREAIHRSHEKQKHMQAMKQQQTSAPAGQNATAAAAPVTSAVPSAIPAAVEPSQKKRRTSAMGAAPAGFPGARPLAHPASPAGRVPSMVQVGQGARPAVAASGGVPMQQVGGKPATQAKPPVSTVPGLAFSNGQVIMPKTTGPKPQEDHTLINCFSVEQIELHIKSLNNGLVLPPLKLKTKAMELLRSLQSHQHAWVFNTPVDPVELGLPDYFQVIKHPMDLGTVRKKLENGVYTKLADVEKHILLTFDNAMLYNPEGSVVFNMASEMKTKFKDDFAKLMVQLNAEEEIKRRNGEACLLCGCEKLLFEPPVFYCNGMNCPSKRIRRNSYYYVAGNNQYHWCHQCYQDIRDNATLDLGDLSVRKESMTKKKNDEVHEESWVQCDRCERWVHQICALFNTRQNKDQRSEYSCPQCTIDERKKAGNLEAGSCTPMAEDLPRTKLSEYLENHVRTKVDEFIEQQSKDKATKEGIDITEARKKLQMGGAITIRQVTSMDRKLEVRERMKKRYAFRNYPDEFSFRCKCIVVFQNLDGVDVVLFGLYVYEHDEKNPAPNKRTVYISYLDSVHYMRPRQMRTFIYHEILISYLDMVRRKGFRTAHIWACPPLKGDDYILYAKPEDQKVPKDDRLRQWYIDMLVEAQKRGIVGTVTNMHDLYFADPKYDATVVPYMDGDYFPAEVENIIKDIEDGKTGTGKKAGTKGNDKSKKAKQKKNKAGRSGTRSAGLDEDALKASGLMPPGTDPKSLEEGARDYVMVKLGETIQPMKESFLVAFLACRGAKEEDMVVPKKIQEIREKNGVTWKLEDDLDAEKSQSSDDAKPAEKKGPIPAPEAATAAAAPVEGETSVNKNGDESSESKPTTTESQKPATTVDTPADATENAKAVDSGETKSTQEISTNQPAASGTPTSNPVSTVPLNTESAAPAPCASAIDQKKDDASAPAAQKSDADKPADPVQDPKESSSERPASTGTSAPPVVSASNPATAPKEDIPMPDATKSVDKPTPPEQPKQDANVVIREGKFAAMAARKRNLDGEPKAEKEKKKEDAKKPEEKEKDDSKTITVKDSKGRLVKVLDDDDEELDCEFLNNRQAFLNLCQGNHYQFDMIRRAKHSSMMVLWHLHNRDAPKFVQQCATCSREILSGYRFHCPTCADFDQCQECVQNPKIPRHPHSLKAIAITNAQQNELTDTQRKERQRSIQLHMTLLLHAATCASPKCPSANCTKMKGLLKHGAQCQVKATGGCNVCKRIWALLQIHARQCKAKACPVPNCMAIRERVRQLKQQQQAMDDRRRQEMNRAYARSGKR